MLNKLEIKNVALIDSVTIEFNDKLNVLSGETGSGKSVILESLNFVLGAKADKSLIRTGEDYCLVCAEFDVSNNSDVCSVYESLDFDYDQTLIITRKFTIEGKNTIKINGNTANVSMLRKFSECLVDVHGQSDHFSLLSKTNQLKLIDSFGAEEIQNIKDELKVLYNSYKQILATLEDLGGDENKRNIELDLLSYQINEILKADIQDGEKEKLLDLKQKLIYQEKISNSLNLVKSSMSEDGGVSDILSTCLKSVSSISHVSSEYDELCNRINALYAECDDIISTTNNLLENSEFEELDADYIENRLRVIKQIERKYGENYNEIQDYLSKITEQKQKLENYAEIFEKEQANKLIYQEKLYKKYLELSKIRIKICKDFENRVLGELQQLGMKNASFSIKTNEIPEIQDVKFNTANGLDDIEFLFSANKGEPVKNMSQIISGGEMSRFMLAIKAQSAKHNQVSTYIFDEIDAGISGLVAHTVAKKLYAISKDKQVIAISHLPQISIFADNNLLISKYESEEKTKTEVKKLSEDEKILEIMRLIGGNSDSLSAKEHAKELILEAQKIKKIL